MHTHNLSGTTRVSWCQKKTSGFYGAMEDNRGRHTNNPAGRHSIQTNQHPPPSSPTIFMSDALPTATLPLYTQAPNMLACISSGASQNAM